MQKNLVIAIILSTLIYIVWFSWIAPPPKPLQQQSTQTSSSIQDKKEVEPSTPDIKKILEKKSQATNVEYILKNDKARYILNSDLSIKSVIYSGPVQDVDLIIDKSKPFLSSAINLDYKKVSQSVDSITLSAKTKDLEFTKKLTISKNNTMNLLEIEIKNKSNRIYKLEPIQLSLGPGLNTVKSEEKDNHTLWQAIYSYQREGRKNPVIEKIKSDYNMGDWLWSAIDNRYFLFAVMNDNNFSGIKYSQETLNEHKAPFINLVTKEIILNPSETKRQSIKFYCGPKDYSLLKSFKNGLHLSVDFGFFAPFAKIFNSMLKYFYNITKNYGVAIILLSVIIQIIMLPLSMKSYKAMAVMKQMQPEMKSIQERYKKDPQRMNMELMQLYKKYGANPFSGCWPMLLQIPIFFALFTTLRNSWDLHGSAFILWIKDLSAKDPYYVLPIFMGVLMFLQNYLTPQPSTDQSQAAIMKWMPIIFTFMFLTFPSGLVLYWIVNSLFSMAQNYYLKKNMEN